MGVLNESEGWNNRSKVEIEEEFCEALSDTVAGRKVFWLGKWVEENILKIVKGAE